MNHPPLLLHLRIPCGKGYSGLWLPWFLVYALLLPLIIILLPFIILWTLVLIPAGKAGLPFAAIYYFWQVLVNLRGLKIDIESSGRKLLLAFV